MRNGNKPDSDGVLAETPHVYFEDPLDRNQVEHLKHALPDLESDEYARLRARTDERGGLEHALPDVASDGYGRLRERADARGDFDGVEYVMYTAARHRVLKHQNPNEEPR